MNRDRFPKIQKPRDATPPRGFPSPTHQAVNARRSSHYYWTEGYLAMATGSMVKVIHRLDARIKLGKVKALGGNMLLDETVEHAKQMITATLRLMDESEAETAEYYLLNGLLTAIDEYQMTRDQD